MKTVTSIVTGVDTIRESNEARNYRYVMAIHITRIYLPFAYYRIFARNIYSAQAGITMRSNYEYDATNYINVSEFNTQARWA